MDCKRGQVDLDIVAKTHARYVLAGWLPRMRELMQLLRQAGSDFHMSGNSSRFEWQMPVLPRVLPLPGTFPVR
jgi:hypothetical protein